MDKLNHTKQKTAGRSAVELLEEERKALGSLLPTPLVCAEQIQLRVDKYATVSYRTNRYLVLDDLVGKFVDVFIYAETMQVFYQNRQAANHQLDFGKHQWIIDIEHFLSIFKRKPGALPRSTALTSNRYLRELYQSLSYVCILF